MQSLNDVRDKNTNIIIADIHDKQAAVVLCEAYKLQVKNDPEFHSEHSEHSLNGM